jgi:hypothetical protein
MPHRWSREKNWVPFQVSVRGLTILGFEEVRPRALDEYVFHFVCPWCCIKVALPLSAVSPRLRLADSILLDPLFFCRLAKRGRSREALRQEAASRGGDYTPY